MKIEIELDDMALMWIDCTIKMTALFKKVNPKNVLKSFPCEEEEKIYLYRKARKGKANRKEIMRLGLLTKRIDDEWYDFLNDPNEDRKYPDSIPEAFTDKWL